MLEWRGGGGGRGRGSRANPAGLRRRQRPGQQAKLGPHAGAIAAAILNDDARHDGDWTLPRLCAEVARRGGPAISPQKGYAWRRPRHTLKGRQDAAAVAASRRHLTDLKTQTAAEAIDLVFLDESEALMHPYLARCWARRGTELRIEAPG